MAADQKYLNKKIITVKELDIFPSVVIIIGDSTSKAVTFHPIRSFIVLHSNEMFVLDSGVRLSAPVSTLVILEW